MSIRVLVVEPERRPEVREIDSSLEVMQSIVGGLIQPIYFDDSVALVCNDEGKLMNLPANRGLRDKDGQIYDIVAGTFFLCGTPADCDHFTSLTPEQIERYQKRFHTPEMFWDMDGCKTIEQIGDNLYLAEVNGVRCTAIFNFFTGAYYVDDVYGVRREAVDA